MVCFTSILFASLAGLSSVSAIPTPTPLTSMTSALDAILNLGPIESGNVAKRLDGDQVGEIVLGVLHGLADIFTRDVPAEERTIYKRSSGHWGGATYTEEGLVSHL